MTLGVIVELYSVLGDSDPQAYQLRLNSAGYIASVIAYYDKEAIVQKGCIVSGVSPIPLVPRPANLLTLNVILPHISIAGALLLTSLSRTSRKSRTPHISRRHPAEDPCP